MHDARPLELGKNHIEALSDGVFAIAMQADQRMVIGGSFTKLGAVTRNFIARMITNGAPDLSFDPGDGPDGTAPRTLPVPGP